MDLPLVVLSLVGNAAGKRVKPRPSPSMPRYHSQHSASFADAETQDSKRPEDAECYTYREEVRVPKAAAVVRLVHVSHNLATLALKPASAASPQEFSADLFSNKVLHDRLNPISKPHPARSPAVRRVKKEHLLTHESRPPLSVRLKPMSKALNLRKHYRAYRKSSSIDAWPKVRRKAELSRISL